METQPLLDGRRPPRCACGLLPCLCCQCCCRTRGRACSGYIALALVLVGAVVTAIGWECCSLWLEPPAVTFDHAVHDPPPSISIDPPILVFRSAFRLRIDNPNALFGTVTAARIKMWYLDPDNAAPALRTTYLAEGALVDSAEMRPHATSELTVQVTLSSSVAGSAALLQMAADCARQPPLVRFLFNLTEVRVRFLGVLPITLTDVVFGVNVTACVDRRRLQRGRLDTN